MSRLRLNLIALELAFCKLAESIKPFSEAIQNAKRFENAMLTPKESILKLRLDCDKCGKKKSVRYLPKKETFRCKNCGVYVQ